MTLASAHIPLTYTIGPAVAAFIAVIWYWLHLSREDVPKSRRRIRRVSLSIIAVTIPLLLTALSVVDPEQQASAYVIVWSIAALLILFIITTAVVDALNNLRLHREMRHDQLINTAVQLSRAARSSESRETINLHNNGVAVDDSAKARKS